MRLDTVPNLLLIDEVDADQDRDRVQRPADDVGKHGVRPRPSRGLTPASPPCARAAGSSSPRESRRRGARAGATPPARAPDGSTRAEAARAWPRPRART